jgi:hypothetical protein
VVSGRYQKRYFEIMSEACQIVLNPDKLAPSVPSQPHRMGDG